MSENWVDAARRYRNKDLIYDSEKINQVTRELNSFIEGKEGHDAMDLLAASGKCIVIGKESITRTTTYFFSSEGPGRYNYKNDPHIQVQELPPFKVPEKAKLLSVEGMAIVAINPHIGKKKPKEIMPWLRDELDKIAADAPPGLATQ